MDRFAEQYFPERGRKLVDRSGDAQVVNELNPVGGIPVKAVQRQHHRSDGSSDFFPFSGAVVSDQAAAVLGLPGPGLFEVIDGRFSL